MAALIFDLDGTLVDSVYPHIFAPNCYVVGDAVWDLLAARRAGCSASAC